MAISKNFSFRSVSMTVALILTVVTGYALVKTSLRRLRAKAAMEADASMLQKMNVPLPVYPGTRVVGPLEQSQHFGIAVNSSRGRFSVFQTSGDLYLDVTDAPSPVSHYQLTEFYDDHLSSLIGGHGGSGLMSTRQAPNRFRWKDGRIQGDIDSKSPTIEARYRTTHSGAFTISCAVMDIPLDGSPAIHVRQQWR